MSLQRIATIFLGTIGIASLIFAIWVVFNVPYTSFAALMFAVGGVAIIAIAFIVYRSTSFLDVIRAITSWILILSGIPPTVLALWSILSVSTPYAIALLVMGVALGALGWTLLKPKVPISIAQRLLSGLCITSGVGAIILPIFVLSIYGTGIVFANIAPIYIIAGVALIVFAIRLRRPAKAEEN